MSKSLINKDAKELVENCLKSCLPPNVPTPVNKFINAKIVASKKAFATVELFDGKEATIEVTYPGTYCYRWTHVDGNPFNWNGEKWERVDEAKWHLDAPASERKIYGQRI